MADKITVIEDAKTGEVVDVHGPDCPITAAVQHVVEELGMDVNSPAGRAAAAEFLENQGHTVTRRAPSMWTGWGPGSWGQKHVQ